MRRTTINHRPFGLVDLVVILTILIGISALLLPVIYNTVEQAKSVSCTANLKNLSTWTGMYTLDSDGYLPSYEDGWIAPIAEKGGVTVNQNTAPKDDFACPNQPIVSPDPSIAPGAYWRGSTYGINQHLASSLRRADGTAYPAWTNANLKSISDPARKTLIADASGSNFFLTPDRDPTIAGLSSEGGSFADAMMPNPARPLPALRHQDNTANFLFLDGHSEFKDSFPMFMTGRGTGGYEFWHGEHWYPESGLEPPEETDVKNGAGNK